jgi:hypothetical protein
MTELEGFDRENVCYVGPDASDGSAVLYFCLSRMKPDHLKVVNCILVRIYLLCAAISSRPYNVIVDCSGVQALNPTVIGGIKDMAKTLLSAFEPAVKKHVVHVFLVHPSADALHSIQIFLMELSPKLWRKVRKKAAFQPCCS